VTPDNAFVEVLPRAAADAPFYNYMKEMVVVHTGLELGATIYLDYTITTTPYTITNTPSAIMPDIFMPILQTSPVKEFVIKVTTPEQMSFRPSNIEVAYELHGLNARPKESVADGIRTATWTLHNLPAASREPGVSIMAVDVPYLAVSTFASQSDALQVFGEQVAHDAGTRVEDMAAQLTEGKQSDEEKLYAILAFVNSEVANCGLSLKETGFMLRDADDVLVSAYGTQAEKANLLFKLLQKAGIDAAIVADYSVCGNTALKTLGAIHDILVVARIGDKQYVLNPLNNRVALASSSDYACIAPIQGNFDGWNIDSAMSYDMKINIAEGKAVANVEATVGGYFLPYSAEPYKALTAGGEDVKASAEGVTYRTNAPLTEVNGYMLLTLPDSPEGISHRGYAYYGSQRTSNLLLPYAPNEKYTYSIDYGKDTLTPETQPSTKKISNKAGEVVISVVVANEGTVEVTRSIKINARLITPALYKDFNALVTAWQAEDGRTLMFKKR
jgi:hypothetical protein